MIITPPGEVLSPRDFVEDVQVILNTGEDGFSIARIVWDGNPCVGIRWNIARREWDQPDKINDIVRCVGMPSSRGHPVWFILPDELLDRDSKIWDRINAFLNQA